MLSLLLLVLTILLSMLVVRVGAIALEITGLRTDHANFQALSAYSGVGYTTQEAEFTLSHPQRRRVIQTLIRLGSAGVMTTMATLVLTVLSSRSLLNEVLGQADNGLMARQLTIAGISVNLTQLLLVGVIGALFALYRLLSNPAVSRLLQELVTQVLVQRHWVSLMPYEELAILPNGLGIVQVDLSEDSPLVGQTIASAGFQARQIQVLALERLSDPMLAATPDCEMQAGDRLVLFGPLATIHHDRQLLNPLHWQEGLALHEPFLQHKQSKRLLRDAPLPVGTMAPDFKLPDQNRQLVSLSAYRGRFVILVFYPKDRSFTCSLQLKTLARQTQQLLQLNVQVLAINTETSESHARFCQQLAFNNQHGFPVLSDSTKQVCKAYKALMLGGLLVNRTVYVIDPEGRVVYAQRGNPSIIALFRLFSPRERSPAIVSSAL